MRQVLLILALSLCGCMKASESTQLTSKLSPDFQVDVYGSTAVCLASFTDGTGNFVELESDALVQCNGQVMTYSGGYYSRSILYTGPMRVSIMVLRPKDGSTLVSHEDLD